MDTAKAIRTTCPYCGVGCGVLVERDGDHYKVSGDPEHPSNFGRLCSKGSSLGETLGLDDRLLHPEIEGRQANWEEAFDLIANKFSGIIREHGPDAVAFYVSGQLLTEDYYVANKLMKGFIGSANIDTNSRLCMSSAVAAHKRAFGADTVPGCYEDLELADLVVLAGSNAAWAHPVLFQRIAAAKQARPEMKVVVIDPRRTATCDIANLHLAIQPGSDAWLFNGLLNYLKREDAIAWTYLEAHVEGFGEALKAVNGISIPKVAQHCGLAEADIAEFYRLFAQTPKTVTLFSQGINQSSSGTDKGNAILNAHLATGRVGLPGASPFSLTGQPNAMGGREVGGLANQLAAHMDFAPEHVDLVGRFWNAPHMAQQPGLKAVDMFEAVRDGRIKAVWIMATNPVVSMPEADRVAEALKTCEFVVISDTTRHTDTAQFAHVLLPAAAWGEKNGTVTNSERRILRQRAFLPPPGEARPDWWIVSEVAKHMGFADVFDYNGPDAIFREHAALSAFENDGERDFNLAGLADLTANEYATLMPVQWPIASKHKAGTPRLFAQEKYFTPTGKARMLAVTPRGPARATDDTATFVLNTGRIRDQWHTMTRTGKAAKLLAHIGEPYVEIHPQDAQRLGIGNGALARLSNQNGEMLARVMESTEQRPGSLFAPIHWNGQFTGKGRADVLVNAVTDPISGQPEFKHAPVAIEAYPAAWHGFVISREAFACADHAYWTRIRGNGFWRHELADAAGGADWPAVMRKAFGQLGDWIELKDSAAQRYRGALLRDGRLQVVCFFERDPVRLPQRHWLASLFEKGALSDSERIALLSGRAPNANSDCGRVVCACFSVGENTLREAIAKGVDSVEALGIQLKAGSNCGSCIPELRKLLLNAAERTENYTQLAATG